MAEVFGVNAELIDSKKCLEKWPVMSEEGILGGVWLPDDGKVEPKQLTQCLAKGAEDNGVKIFELETPLLLYSGCEGVENFPLPIYIHQADDSF